MAETTKTPAKTQEKTYPFKSLGVDQKFTFVKGEKVNIEGHKPDDVYSRIASGNSNTIKRERDGFLHSHSSLFDKSVVMA